MGVAATLPELSEWTLTYMTDATSAVLFRSESKGSGFHANERL